MRTTVFRSRLLACLAASVALVPSSLIASVGTLLRFDFNDAPAWPVTSEKPALPGVAHGKFGTADTSGSAEASGGLRLKMDRHAQPGWSYGAGGYIGPSDTAGKDPLAAMRWSAVLRSGPLAVQNTESHLGKLTLSFSLAATRALPIRVVVESSMRSSSAPAVWKLLFSPRPPISTSATPSIFPRSGQWGRAASAQRRRSSDFHL